MRTQLKMMNKKKQQQNKEQQQQRKLSRWTDLLPFSSTVPQCFTSSCNHFICCTTVKTFGSSRSNNNARTIIT